MAGRKYIITVIRPNREIATYGNLKKACEEEKLEYKIVKTESFPIKVECEEKKLGYYMIHKTDFISTKHKK